MSKANSNTSTNQQVFRGEVIETFPRRTIEPMMSSRTGSMMVKNAMLQIGSDKCLALTTQSAMQNCGMLAAMADHLGSVSPRGNDHYQALLDAYAQKAIEMIGGR
ncbi:MAG: hypothetical protein K1W27_03270 [Lachnospiraceae bacterium]|jgi:hypothetical protein|uniref:hypothetical protein n=1 Tax=Faecalibaculum rodentium TaxID=1702221 RepID=UPI00272B57EB|nr:hypothetical protein [Faecalibaculum rodentium]